MLSLIPLPASVKTSNGVYTLTARSSVAATGKAIQVADRLRADIRPATGFDLPLAESGDVRLVIAESVEGPEGYRLSVDESGITILAETAGGLFYGTRTLLQLLPAEVFGGDLVDSAWTVPYVEIADRPRFAWRGAHFDVARHFMPKPFVLKFIDEMAAHKLNLLHFHLTEDQGWRIEIRKYPKLTEVGAWRTESMSGHYEDQMWNGTPHGGFYTQDDIREIVAYAAERFITVMPEIEMPGHAQAAIAAYPELGNTGKQLAVATSWGVFEDVFNAEDSTIRFLQDVLDEVLELFPSKFIHVGGDECPKKQWKESPRAQERIQELGLKDEDELQSWFIGQMDRYLESKGRRLVGWDEILEGGLAPGATVMSWRGEEGGVAAAKSGHDVVMTPSGHTYFDYYQSEDPASEPVAIGGFTSVEKAYSYEPIPGDLTPEEAKHVLGSQFQLWTEYMPTPEQVEYMAWPRGCAFSEVVWSSAESRDYSGFSARLTEHLRRLDLLGVNYRKG